MPRRPDDNVVPFRRPRKWTRPEDFGHDPGKPPRDPRRKPPAPPPKWAAWAVIIAVVAGTVAWNLWG